MSCNTWFYRKIEDWEEFDKDDVHEFDNDTGSFVTVDEYFNIFRIGGYPHTVLNDLTETLFYIYCSDPYLYNINWYNLVLEFWEKYPEGKIDFG